MTERTEPYSATGLCGACNHGPWCALPATGEWAIWHCEEYDDRGGQRTVAMEVAPPAPAPARRASQAGICCNCLNLPTCLLPKSAGTVWRCEEYL